MKFGLPISFVFHALVLSGGILLWQGKVKTVETVKIIPLSIVTVSDRTNVKTTRKKPVKQAEMVETAPPVVEKPAVKPVETPPEPAITPEQVTQKTPEKTQSEKTTPEPSPVAEAPEPAFNLDAFSDMVAKAREDNPDANTQAVLEGEVERAKHDQNGAGDRDGMTVSPTDYIRAKMEPCWHIDKGAKGYQSLRVEIALELDPSGEISTLNIRNSAQIIASGSSAWRAARENVVAALNECAPYVGLQAQDYDIWKTMRLNFQPGDT